MIEKKYKVKFNPKDHTYEVEGKPVPSVSAIISELNYEQMKYIDPYYSDRGTYIHRCTELDDAGELDFDKLSDEIKPYITAWRKFREDYKLISKPYIAELKLGCPEFAGTLDRYYPNQKMIVDIKSGSRNKYTHSLQLIGYHELLVKNEIITPDPAGLEIIPKHIDVYIKNNGKYYVRVIDENVSFDDWYALKRFRVIKRDLMKVKKEAK